jgi:uncharacterized membrane protein YphA (DoxX/SURF4 family)
MDRNTLTTAAAPSFLARVDGLGHWLAPLGLRALLAYEYVEAGLEKLHGENWFAEIADKFPAPFSLLPANVNWAMATWVELIAGIALLVGLGTRYAAAALFVLTIVAIQAVHWPAEWSSFAELWQGLRDHRRRIRQLQAAADLPGDAAAAGLQRRRPPQCGPRPGTAAFVPESLRAAVVAQSPTAPPVFQPLE